jgi:hypothetical protein
MIDRASIVTNAILSVICETGLGEKARARIRKILQDAFCAIEHDAISEFRLRPEDDE